MQPWVSVDKVRCMQIYRAASTHTFPARPRLMQLRLLEQTGLSMKNWSTFAKVLFWFAASLIAFILLRLLLPAEYVPMIAGIPGIVFVGYMANLGAQMVRRSPPPPNSPQDLGPPSHP